MPNYINLNALKGKKNTNTPLYDFQEAGVEILTAKRRIILADEMGVGKTPQAIVTADRLKCKKVLILCPASLKTNWEREIEKFIGEKNVEIVNEILPVLRDMQIQSGARFTIMNYEQISERISILTDERLPAITKYNREKLQAEGKISINERNLPTMKSVPWDMIICDEAHRLKNPETQAFKALDQILEATCCPNLLLLTGTPILNRPDEIWTLLHLIDKEAAGSYGQWQIQYCYSPTKFRDKIAPYMLRREKKDVLTLPDKTYQDIEVELGDRHRRIYNQMRDEMYYEFADKNLIVEAVCFLAQVIRLKQIAISPDLLDKGSDEIKGAKIDALMDIIEGSGDQKLVIFTQYAEVAKRLYKKFQGMDLNPTRIIGEDGVGEIRQRNIDTFQNDKSSKICLCTIRAGGVGLTLTAATIAVFTDLDWTPAINGQASDRLHRIGQKDNVTIYTLTALNTIEAYIQSVLREKTDMFNANIPVNQINGMLKDAFYSRRF